MEDLKQLVLSIFKEKFNEEPLIVRSPGRVNLIGEHTDYNMGFVLPAAINKAAYIALSKRDDDEINIVAADLDDEFSTTLSQCAYSEKEWPNYIVGVVDQLLKADKKL